MSPCQLCGAHSWGPVPANLGLLIRLQEFSDVDSVDLSQYRRCDHCHSIAKVSLLEVERDEPQAVPMEVVRRSTMLQLMEARVANQTTRTERLVTALTASPLVLDLPVRTPEVLVAFVRDLEHELDGDGPEFGPTHVRMPMQDFRTLLTRALQRHASEFPDHILSSSLAVDSLINTMEHDFNE